MSDSRNSKVIFPKEVSKVDVLKGLWDCSSPARFFQTIPNGDEVRKKQEAAAWESKEKVEKTSESNPRNDYFGGRCIKTDLSKYPEVDLASYKRECGIEMPVEEIKQYIIKSKL